MKQGYDLGKNWQDLSGGEKAAKIGLAGLGSAAAGVGAVMLGASGPVGWGVAGAVALTTLAVGLAQTQDGFEDLEEESEKLSEAQEIQADAQQEYNDVLDSQIQTMADLRDIEEQTGISGEALQKQVDAGTKSVDNMTAAELRVYAAYQKVKTANNELAKATENKKNADHNAEIQALRVEAVNAIEADSYDLLREKVVKAWEEGSISAEEAGDVLSRALAGADEHTQKVLGENIPNEIKECYNPDRYESGFRKFTTWITNGFIEIASSIGRIFDGIGNWWNDSWLSSAGNWLTGQGWQTNTEKEAKKQAEANAEIDATIARYRANLDRDPTLTEEERREMEEEFRRKLKGNIGATASFAVGTNYVPSDGLAYLHQGEAVIPKKYNQPYQQGLSAEERVYMQQMMTTMRSLDDSIKQGITVNGEFTQRGSDLVAVVNRTKSQAGADLISNVAYAR